MESDPEGLDGDLNTYAYVDSDPLGFVDPEGLFRYNKPAPDTVPVSPGMELKVSSIEKCWS